MGMSSPILETKSKGKFQYNRSLAKKRARSVYQYIFNAANEVSFPHTNLVFKKTKVSGNGLRFLAKENAPKSNKHYLKAYCQINDCKRPNGLLFKIYEN